MESRGFFDPGFSRELLYLVRGRVRLIEGMGSREFLSIAYSAEGFPSATATVAFHGGYRLMSIRWLCTTVLTCAHPHLVADCRAEQGHCRARGKGADLSRGPGDARQARHGGENILPARAQDNEVREERGEMGPVFREESSGLRGYDRTKNRSSSEDQTEERGPGRTAGHPAWGLPGKHCTGKSR